MFLGACECESECVKCVISSGAITIAYRMWAVVVCLSCHYSKPNSGIHYLWALKWGAHAHTHTHNHSGQHFGTFAHTFNLALRPCRVLWYGRGYLYTQCLILIKGVNESTMHTAHECTHKSKNGTFQRTSTIVSVRTRALSMRCATYQGKRLFNFGISGVRGEIELQ